ncbi:Histidine protein kinase DivJ [Alteripontixanthobacter maritimus]|uniref:histidine kinase n=1 Tax=Alteripontixanthobacter maritimus TaxID=2161824 RepID=A0A369Q7L9_9SPHN|nr:histidine kinase dimerization/phospho-acceptor domain-containing protein [Alteripontixanthobacter maritimus]RDC60380.1 Histidine protein kinase DivJ [Alteripontixanthobacter maritimus]
MLFDDRLTTVLRQRASGDRAARTQYRQLLDLLGSRSAIRDDSLLEAAWLRLSALGEIIPVKERAAILREPGLRIRRPELVLHLADGEPELAAAVIEAARLAEDEWEPLVPRLPIRARGFLRLRRDLHPATNDLLERLGVQDRGLPEPVAEAASRAAAADQVRPPSKSRPQHSPKLTPQPTKQTVSIPPPPREISEIGAIVQRIEAFRQQREAPANDHPRLPLGDPDTLASNAAEQVQRFAFTADPNGRIDWADDDVAPMVVGTRPPELAPNVLRGRPVQAATTHISGADAVHGAWVVDAAPRFSDRGAFLGHAGMFRRPSAPDEAGEARAEADRVRQLLHELRTPVNAIQGFAEVIQQQLFGPTPHEYRAHAAAIAGDAARILSGFEEMDRLARLETSALDIEQGQSDLGNSITAIAAQLRPVLAQRDAGIAVQSGGISSTVVGIAPAETERLAWRLLATVAGKLAARETLALQFTSDGDRNVTLVFNLPASLAKQDDIFASTAPAAKPALSAGMFGSGFALRLARAEAKAAGGTLQRDGNRLELTLPAYTGMANGDSVSKQDEAGEQAG